MCKEGNKQTPNEQFWAESKKNIEAMTNDKELQNLGKQFFDRICEYKVGYNFSWLGRPIIALPTDIVALQEMVYDVKPDLIIETGIAHGGSIILSASLLELLGQDGMVVGIDIDIRSHNRIEIERHEMFHRITMLEGSSIDQDIIAQVKQIAKGKKKIMVLLDSCHTEEHVLAEMEAYGELVTKDSYLVVYDTSIEFQPDSFNFDRPWAKGNNPYTATEKYLSKHDEFIVDTSFDEKYMITCAPKGRLRKIK